MSAFEVTEKLVEAINSGRFDTIICNYANCDQVGHTGNFDASVKAVETVDSCLKQVVEAAEKQDGEVLITADHGNVEEMFDEASNQPHTQHTTLPVPLVYAGSRQLSLDSGGSLADIAPTILDMMGLDKPAEMSGRSLIR
jgi:2,3-bisphosphoglycerate-independent phosphoglycerate mutase